MRDILKSILLAVMILTVVPVKAHQADISTFTLVEEQPGHWMLQLNAAMTAFQYEVRNAYGNNSYASPEEFNQLLLNHMKNNISIEVNGQNMMLKNGLVQLGHATTVAFELTGVPHDVKTVFVKNEGFENIQHSQSIFTIAKEGVNKSSFILSAANDFQVDVSLSGNKVLLAESSWYQNWSILLGIVVMACVSGFIFYQDSTKKIARAQDSLTTV